MTGRTHDLAAFTALGVVAIATPSLHVSVATALVAILANMIGGIAPDIDQPTAPLWRNLPIGRLFGGAFDNLMGGHRFLTHSLLGVGIFGYLAHLFLGFISPITHDINLNVVWWAFMVGLVSHLVMDSFTKEGVPWLLPVPVRFGFPPIKAWRLTTGKLVEMFIIFPGLALFAIWYASQHYDHLLAIIGR